MKEKARFRKSASERSSNALFRGSLGLRRLALMALIILAAFALRVYDLNGVPPGLTHDEAAHGHDAATVLAGFRPIYFTVGYGREPLYDYVNAGWFTLVGRSVFTLRLASVFWSLPMIALTYAWARRAFGGATALLAAGLLAVSFWPLATARQALRSTALPTIFLVAVISFQRLAYMPRTSIVKARHSAIGAWDLRIGILTFTLALAACLYIYIPARFLWLLFPAALIHFAVFQPALLRRAAWPLAIGLLFAGALAIPLFTYLWTHPGTEGRLEMLDAPVQALREGNLGPILVNAREALLSYFLPGHGDTFLAYNLPGRPFFDPLTALLFFAGVLLCLRRIREPAPAFALLWLLIGIAPALITGPLASFTRSLGAQPITYVLPALALETAVSRVTLRLRSGQAHRSANVASYVLRFASLLPLSLLLLNAALTSRDYFGAWGRAPEVRAAYQHTLIEELRYLQARPDLRPAVVSTIYPLAPHDPYIADMFMPLDSLRFVDARSGLLFPAGGGALVASAGAPLDPVFAGGLASPLDRVILEPEDLDPYFDVFPLPGSVPLPPGGEVQTEGGSLQTPVNLGNAVEFLGWQMLGQSPVELLTLWRVTDPGAVGPSVPPAFHTEASLFLHVLNATGAILTQQDTLDAPSWQWRRGDIIAQIHRVTLPPGTRRVAPASLTLTLGLYNRGDGSRLPVLGPDGQVYGDRLLLSAGEPP